MEDKFVVACRYEHWTITGKEFTKWYYMTIDGMPKDEATAYMNKKKTECKDIDKATKLKHEFKLVSYEEYCQYLDEIHSRVNDAKKKYDEYKKSDEYKEIQKRKREERKQLKLRQEKYMKEHAQNET